jgi:HK97 family phage portal protein
MIAARLRELRASGPFNGLADYKRELSSLGSPETRSGIAVSDHDALAHSTVYGCVRVLSTVIGMLPMILYRRTEAGKERATDHPLYPVLHTFFNPRSTAFEAKRMTVQQVSLLGNGPVMIERSRGGAILGLHPFRWDRTELKINSRGELEYHFKYGEEPAQVFPESDVWHIRGASIGGLVGLSVIGLMRETVGHGLAMQSYSQHLFKNDARPGLALKVPGDYNEETVKRLREEWNTAHQGASNTAKMRVLFGGMEVEPIEMPPKDSQWLEARKFNEREICGWFGVDPAYVFAEDAAPRATVEERSREFRAVHLGPWLTMMEQAAERDLLTERERETLFIRFNADALVRTDIQKRAEAHRVGVMTGWLDRNEVREMEDLNQKPGLDAPLVPLNFALLDAQGNPTVIAGTPGDGGTMNPMPSLDRSAPRAPERRGVEARARLAEDFFKTFRQAAERIVAMELRQLRAAVDRHLPDPSRSKASAAGARRRGQEPERRDVQTFSAELDRMYAEGSTLEDFTKRTWAPHVELLIDQALTLASAEGELELERHGLVDWIEGVVGAVTTRTLMSHRARIRGDLGKAAAPRESVLADLELFEKLPDTMARQETRRVARAAAREGFRRSGVQRMVWVTRGGETCPFCQTMSGRVVSITRDEPFLPEGAQLEGAPDAPPLAIKGRTMHPPLHNGCVCDVAPA